MPYTLLLRHRMPVVLASRCCDDTIRRALSRLRLQTDSEPRMGRPRVPMERATSERAGPLHHEAHGCMHSLNCMGHGPAARDGHRASTTFGLSDHDGPVLDSVRVNYVQRTKERVTREERLFSL